MSKMDLRTIAETLNNINHSRAAAATELETAIGTLLRCFEHYDRALGHVRRLDDEKALSGERAVELRELCSHLLDSRNVMAEFVHVARSFARDPMLHNNERNRTAAAAHEGMHAKRLAELERELLREAVVAGLAGEP